MTRTASAGGIAAFAGFSHGFSAAFDFPKPLPRLYVPAGKCPIPLNSSFIFYLLDMICALCFYRERFLRARSRFAPGPELTFCSFFSLFRPLLLCSLLASCPWPSPALPISAFSTFLFFPCPPSFPVSSFFPAFPSLFLLSPPALPSAFSPFASLFPFRLFSGGTLACLLPLSFSLAAPFSARTASFLPLQPGLRFAADSDILFRSPRRLP